MRRKSSSFAIAFASLTAALASQATWTKAAPTASPSMRRAGAMSFDNAGPSPRLLLQGGLTQTPGVILGETWTYNGTTWTPVSSAGGPARWGHQMVRVPSPNRVITFGGRSPTVSALSNQTWSWNGTAWSQVTTATAPAPRFRYGMTYDTTRNRVVLFGGRTANETLNDTWELNPVDPSPNWTSVTSTNTPPPREDMTLVFDPVLNRTILFGGYDTDTGTLRGDTWEFDGTEWREVVTTATAPPLLRTSAGFDTLRKRIYLFGGFDGTSFSNTTYEFTGSAWNVIAVATAGTPFSTENYFAFDSQRNRLVTFGGVGLAFSADTWEFNGTGPTPGLVTTPIVGMYGEGCETSGGIAQGGVPGNGTGLPNVGQTYQINWTQMPPVPSLVLPVHGLTNPVIDLEVLGFIGCNLLVAPDLIMPAAVAPPDTFSTQLALPTTGPSLINVALYTQLVIFDPSAPNGAGGTSRGVRAIIGKP